MYCLERTAVNTGNATIRICRIEIQRSFTPLRQASGSDISKCAYQRNFIGVAASCEFGGYFRVIVAGRGHGKSGDTPINRIKLCDSGSPRAVTLDFNVWSAHIHPIVDFDTFRQSKRNKTFAAWSRDRMIEIALVAGGVKHSPARVGRETHPLGITVEKTL